MILNFDKHSLLINNKRILVRSAAFHYFRCPGADVWKDRLSKLKACGYNAVDLYFNWGYHSHHPGIYDFTENKDIRTLLDITADLGLFVIARPGPFINGEVSGGGLPCWLFNVPDVVIRNRKDCDFIYSEPYMRAVKEWYSRIIPIINEYNNIIAFQIENEYSTNMAEPDYMQELYDMSRAMGVKAPIFHNDAFGACLYSDIVNIYALDTYPTINFNYDWRDNPYGFGVLDCLEENIRECSLDSPLFIAELQSGWFDKWDGFGYEYIRSKLGREHINIVTKTALSQGVTMFNHYMACGGTSWDQLACDEVYTSYDFAAPVSEFGIPQENYYKAKEINYFLQAFNLAETDAAELDIPDQNDGNLFIKARNDNLNNCKWLFIRNLNGERKNLELVNGFKTELAAYDMKILPAGLDLFGCRIDFSGLSIFGRVEKENYEIILMLLDDNNEVIISDFEECSGEIPREPFDNRIKLSPCKDLSSCKFTRNGKVTEFIFLNQETSDKTWILEDKIIIGPDFLLDNPFKAAISRENEKNLKIITPNFEWQVKEISPEFQETKLPEKLHWSFYKCAPEIEVGYDYSSWNFAEPDRLDCISNRVYNEFIWYKGTFTGVIDQMELDIKHCYSIYINGIQVFHHDFLHYDCGKELDELITINIDKKVFKHNNEITVLVQNMGFNKGFENPPDLPRGILTLKTEPQKDIEWQIRGGLTPEIEEWAFVSEKELNDASENSYLVWAETTFEYKKPDNVYSPLSLNLDSPPFDIANIYLNGNLIGRYRKTKCAQTIFYLMDGFLQEKNSISLVIWNQENHQKIEDYKFDDKNVNIKIGCIGFYDLFSFVEIL
jgi:hypothetical protein